MGCWAINSFGNDDAADWIADLIERNDLDLARETIEELLSINGYVDAPYATQALAAIEVIAAALGRPTEAARAEEALMSWVSRVAPTVSPTLITQALAAIERILGPESELHELWEDTDDFADWQSEVAALNTQLLA